MRDSSDNRCFADCLSVACELGLDGIALFQGDDVCECAIWSEAIDCDLFDEFVCHAFDDSANPVDKL